MCRTEEQTIYDIDCSYFRIDELRINRLSETVIRHQDLPVQLAKKEEKGEEKVEEKTEEKKELKEKINSEGNENLK